MPQLVLRVIGDKDAGKGYLETVEQGSTIRKARVEMISYDNGADKKQLIYAPLQFIGSSGNVKEVQLFSSHSKGQSQ
jgi:hypothetical protein